MKNEASHESAFGVDERSVRLLQDIRTVDWGKQVPQFHLNTKLHHLLTDGCLDATGWLENCEKFVAGLPRMVVTCGWRNEQVDPFRGAREAFPSNRTVDPSSLIEHVFAMWRCARKHERTRHTGLYHGNLLEILEISGIVDSGTARDFYVSTLGLDRTPSEEIEELMLEGAADAMLGTGEAVELEGGGTLHLSNGGHSVLWQDEGGETYLSMDGHGCICRWRVLHGAGAAIVIQAADAPHTSVTNMAEKVRDACRTRFGGETKCYEFYEARVGENHSLPCEITGEAGEIAGWIPVPIGDLSLLSEWILARGGVGGQKLP